MALAAEDMVAAFPAERVGHAPPADLIAQRAGQDAAVQSGLWRCDPTPLERQLAGIRCLEFMPTQKPRGTILHFHGGAFRLARPEQVAGVSATGPLHWAICCSGGKLAFARR
jgi:acetyl esterase/lipase